MGKSKKNEIDMDALIVFLSTTDDGYDRACTEALMWIAENRNKSPDWIWKNLTINQFSWIRARLGLDLERNITLDDVLRELRTRFKRYKPDRVRRFLARREKLRGEVRSWLRDARDLAKRAKKLGVYDNVLGIPDLDNDADDKLRFPEDLEELVLEIESDRSKTTFFLEYHKPSDG